MKMSVEEAEREPFEDIEKALFIWELDAQRAKLEEERRNLQ